VILLHEYSISIDFVVLRSREFVTQFFFKEKELFQLNGYINGQKNRVWSAKNPQALHKNPQHLSTTGIWCAESRRQIAGSLFFEETITAENYQNLVTQFIAL